MNAEIENIDFEKLGKQLSRSSVRRKVFGHILELDEGSTFFGQDISIKLRVNAHGSLRLMEESGLIARLPEHKKPFPAPFEKSANEHWLEVGKLFTSLEQE